MVLLSNVGLIFMRQCVEVAFRLANFQFVQANVLIDVIEKIERQLIGWKTIYPGVCGL